MGFATLGLMKPLEILDRIVRPIAIPNLTIILVVGQAAMFALSYVEPELVGRAPLVWSKVFEGEVWRLITWVFFPPNAGPLTIFYFLIFHMIGNVLENTWGTVRYCAYLYLGSVLTALVALIYPNSEFNGLFLELTVFLAFATHHPDYEFLIFFILPVKVKYLAMIQAAYYGFGILFSGMQERLTLTAALANYLIFFGPTLVGMIRGKSSQMKRRTRAAAVASLSNDRPRHQCAVCGIDSRTHPRMDFRYCSKCDNEKAYCEAHLGNHDHVRSSDG